MYNKETRDLNVVVQLPPAFTAFSWCVHYGSLMKINAFDGLAPISPLPNVDP